MNQLYDTLFTLVIGLELLAVVMLFFNRLTHKSFKGFLAACFWVQDLLSVLRNGWITFPVFTGIALVYTWLWWKDGGGDDTKRRLRGIMKAFEGTRRTAPVAA